MVTTTKCVTFDLNVIARADRYDPFKILTKHYLCFFLTKFTHFQLILKLFAEYTAVIHVPFIYLFTIDWRTFVHHTDEI